VLGREEAVLLRQGRYPSCYDGLQHLSKHVKKRNSAMA
jgi:hypothetical protein